ncbi:DUF1501 domain-containing protein [Verrucomicrobiaceae bacterium 5K15]|uniref:DUF1501 domain-containing protein n=1 Tax=Oceaniferula flava TaxID=2800421 RepID=A0AAE2VDA7_9BACT|nr:DUF1501 domain-containing protein [Oceaniferula flavus]MBK1856530.1 DUF1501 domain-containing protein [Oceaniferula flavus]MBM1137837.1 DUF1501 domain-containing protein [Oceaniferula flavus]
MPKKSDELTRRQFVANAARTYLGVGLAPMLGSSVATQAYAQSSKKAERKPAESVIFLNMTGGMSHIDTFDVKPGKKEVQGPVEAINTNVDGIQVSQFLPKTAAVMDKICLIRSMSSINGAHERGQYALHRSYTPRGTIVHPTLGAWTMKLRGRKNPEIPGFVTVGGNAANASAGFFGVKYAGVPLGRPDEGLKDSVRAGSVSAEDFERRLKLADVMNKQFHAEHQNTEARAYDELYKEAVRLMRSDDLKAFDIDREPRSSREAYGNNSFGQGCLLARRLVEHGVRFVEVNLGGWDTHYDNFTSVEARCQVLDRAYANLLVELEAKGLLESTIVALTTEFGRSPNIVAEHSNGRDHHPSVYSSLLAGGGFKGGMVYGSSDSKGGRVKKDKVGVQDFNATIATRLGLDTDAVLLSPSGRPFQVAHKGKPVEQLFA